MNIKNFKKFGAIVCFCIVFLDGVFVQGETSKSARLPSLVESLDVKEPLEFCGEPVPLQMQEVRERLEKELLLTLWDRPQVILWLKRSGRYMPHIEKQLNDSRLPGDLKYVSIIESAMRPHAGSPKGAIGFWQFTPHTGRKFGLTVDDRIDERRNIFSSTRAAIEYFKALYNNFGSWTLAAAAFNMGEHGLQSEILLQDLKDYYRLYLPLETQRYVFRILSAKLIFSDPEKYGFILRKKDFYPMLSFDRVEVDCFEEVPIMLIAKAAKTDFKVIKDLNPELRGYSLASGSYKILVPKGASKGFAVRLEKYLKTFQAEQKKSAYLVREGDNLSSIAEKFHIPLPALVIQNRLDPSQPIQPGQRLIIPQGNLRE